MALDLVGAEFTFVGCDVDDKWPHFAWSVQLSYPGSGSLRVPYRCGVAHCTSRFSDHPFYPRKGEIRVPNTHRTAIPKLSVKSNYYYKVEDFAVTPTQPTKLDILHSLFLDATTQSFEEWASDFGYDADSRAAYKVYQACVQTHNDLHRIFGKDFYKIQEEIEALDL